MWAPHGNRCLLVTNLPNDLIEADVHTVLLDFGVCLSAGEGGFSGQLRNVRPQALDVSRGAASKSGSAPARSTLALPSDFWYRGSIELE